MHLVSKHLKSLFRFDGREARQPFWVWVAVVMGMMMVAWMGIFIPSFMSIFGRIEQFAREHPDQVTRTMGPGSYSIRVDGYHPELTPNLSGLIGGLAVILAVIILLLAAAVARRLRDAGKSGWWGLIPLPFLFTGLAVMSRIFATFPAAGSNSELPDGFFRLFGLMMLNNISYLAALITLIVMLCGASKVTQGFDDAGVAD
jgi:uncharacterized membrane protein YhaH (DUF805 family)